MNDASSQVTWNGPPVYASAKAVDGLVPVRLRELPLAADAMDVSTPFS